MKRFFSYLVFASLVLFSFSQAARAATFTVTPTSDNDCSDFDCDLQAALDVAATNNAADTVNIQSGNYNILDNSDAPNTPYKYAPPPAENFSLTIVGMGTTPPTIDGNGANQAMVIDTTGVANPDDGEADISVKGLAFQNGSTLQAGGGLAIFTANADISVDDCSFFNNGAALAGGGAELDSTAGTGSLSLSNSQFDQNNAGNGGAANLHTDSGSLTVTGNTMTGNKATGGGVGAFDQFSNTGAVLCSGNFISGNSAPSGGAGGAEIGSSGTVTVTDNIFLKNTAAGDDGGAEIFGNALDINVTNNTFTGNTAGGNAGGFTLELDDVGVIGNVYNNIVWGNTAGGLGGDIFVENLGGTFNIFNTDYGILDCSVGSCGGSPTNINQDPLFVDLANGDVSLGIGSPCIDSGTTSAPGLPSVDFLGNPRTIGPEPDMGALESLPNFSATPATHDFGPILLGQSASTIITLSNNGANVLNVTGMSLSDATDYSLDVNAGTNPCGSETPTINAGESCTVGVDFNPQSLGALPGTLTLTSDDPNNPSLVLAFTGTGSTFNVSGSGCSMSSTPGSLGGLYLLALPLVLMLRKKWIQRF